MVIGATFKYAGTPHFTLIEEHAACFQLCFFNAFVSRFYSIWWMVDDTVIGAVHVRGTIHCMKRFNQLLTLEHTENVILTHI